MRSQIWNLLRARLGLALKCGSVLFLFLVSVLVVACGANNSAQVPGAPAVTVTINLNQSFASPTPVLTEYACSAWVTDATPPFSVNSIVEVYAKFVHNVNGNPVGMPGARAVATVHWPDGVTPGISTTTTSDGLAVFSVPMQASALNHVVLVTVDFTSLDGHSCNFPPQGSSYPGAFFTAISVSPTDTPGGNPTDTPSVFPTFPKPRRSPTPSLTPSSTP